MAAEALARSLGDRMLRLFAAALSLPQNFFAESHTDSMVALRCLSYPATDAAPLAQQKGGGQSRRQSMAFFYNGSFDAKISCIRTCLDAGAAPKYDSVAAGAYLRQRFSSALEQELPRR